MLAVHSWLTHGRSQIYLIYLSIDLTRLGGRIQSGRDLLLDDCSQVAWYDYIESLVHLSS